MLFLANEEIAEVKGTAAGLCERPLNGSAAATPDACGAPSFDTAAPNDVTRAYRQCFYVADPPDPAETAASVRDYYVTQRLSRISAKYNEWLADPAGPAAPALPSEFDRINTSAKDFLKSECQADAKRCDDMNTIAACQNGWYTWQVEVLAALGDPVAQCGAAAPTDTVRSDLERERTAYQAFVGSVSAGSCSLTAKPPFDAVSLKQAVSAGDTAVLETASTFLSGCALPKADRTPLPRDCAR
jgi:hypothetical protein